MGENLIASMPPEEKTTFFELVNSQPFPRGNFWRAEKGDQVVHILGTYHLEDPRHAPTLARITPYLLESDVILMESNSEDIRRLQMEMARRPEVMFIQEGPTLPELLPEDLWQRFSDEMRVRGVSPILASKFRPGYATMVLGTPPCAVDFAAGKAPEGIDVMIQEFAAENDLKTKSLEPFDTVLQLFELLEEGDPLEALHLGLALSNDATNSFVTMREEYFNGEHVAIWEFGRQTALATEGIDPEVLAADYDKMEKVMVNDRNAHWLPVILEQAEEGDVFVAVGAAHLGREQGVLNGLAESGFTLMQLN
ncbi:TraB/GumN family protein [Falsihalocynthiibacter sp. SS001]|uniref:TraB/GumN family protein n=1 Tax=Falsihalocynthiibacter sp. SS001 TaxID=3349698 RepID=UPI0036D3171D